MTHMEETMLVFAARYAHNRQTGGALMVVTHILSVWDELTERTKYMLYKETHEAGCNLEDWQKIRDRYEDEHRCCNCVYEIQLGSFPACTHDMRHGEACRFFERAKNEK